MSYKCMFILTAIGFFTPICIFAQITFQKEVIRTNLHEAKQTKDGGFIATGWHNNSSFEQDIILLKTDKFGDTIWTKTYGEAEDVLAISMDLTSDGGYIISGDTYNIPDSTPEIGRKIYLIKTDGKGDTLWTKKLGGSKDQDSRCIRQTFDGGYIVSGETNSFGAGNSDMYILKIDAKGKVEWSRTFGGPNNDLCYSVCQTPDSGFVALGTLNAFSSNSDIVLIKMNSKGDTIWTKEFGGVGQDFGHEIKNTMTRGLAITGFTASYNTGGEEAFLLTTDSLGNIQWFKTYGGSRSSYGYSFYQTNDGGFVIGGNTTDFGVVNVAPLVIRLNSSGDTLWSVAYFDDSGVIWSIIQTADNGFLTSGEQHELMKLNSNGKSGCLEQNVHPIISNRTLLQVFDTPITVTIPNTLSSGTSTNIGPGDGLKTYCLTVGVENKISDTNLMYLFPNPAQDYFAIELNSLNKNSQLNIYNSLAEKIYTDILTENKKTIICKQFPSGVYFVKVYDGINFSNKKIIINRE